MRIYATLCQQTGELALTGDPSQDGTYAIWNTGTQCYEDRHLSHSDLDIYCTGWSPTASGRKIGLR